MKAIWVTGSVAVTSMLLASGIGISAPSAVAEAPTSWSLLYAVAGDTATFDPLGRDRYRVTMRQTDATTTWFTDRPVRRTGILPTAGLVGGWRAGGARSFASNPPNVALVAHDPSAGIETVIGIMSVPRWEPISQTLAFTLRVLGSEDVKAGTSHVSTHLLNAHDPAGRPLRLSAVSLFIDDAVLTCSAIDQELTRASAEQARIGAEQNRLNTALTVTLAKISALTPERTDGRREPTDTPGINPLAHTDVLVVRPSDPGQVTKPAASKDALAGLRSAATDPAASGADELLREAQQLDARLAQLRIENDGVMGLLDLLEHQRALACSASTP